MKKVLILVAVSEAATGIALLIAPSLVGWLLFGAQAAGVGILLARVTGIALIALGVACWPSRNPFQAFLGMLTFSSIAMLYLIYVGANGWAGPLLWPAVAVHAGFAALLILMWQKERPAPLATT